MFKHTLLSTFKTATVIFMLSMTLMSCQENQQKTQDSAGKSLPASNTPNPSKHDFNKANYALEKPRILSKAAKYLSVYPKRLPLILRCVAMEELTISFLKVTIGGLIHIILTVRIFKKMDSQP
jgi:hypothetical protein